MRRLQWIIGLVFVLLAFGAPAHAAKGFSPETVKQLYRDGEFEKMRTMLEEFLKRPAADASVEERIVAYKYLGVVYASKPEGKPQAEAYFFRLFDLSPNVELTELYVSSAVSDLFKKTHERFLKEKESIHEVDEYGFPIAQKNASPGDEGKAQERTGLKNKAVGSSTKASIPNPSRQSQASLQKKGPVIWPWVLGAAVVGGGIGVYVLTAEKSGPKKEVIFKGSN